MQLVIAARQIPAVADVWHLYARRKVLTQQAGDAGAQAQAHGSGWVHNPDLDAIDIRRVLRMPEGRTAWLAPVFDVEMIVPSEPSALRVLLHLKE